MDDTQPPQPSRPSQVYRPGDTVSPAQQFNVPPAPVPTPPPVSSPVVLPSVPLSTPQSTPAINPSAHASNALASSTNTVAEPVNGDNEPLIYWTAAEFVKHDKTLRWYFVVLAVCMVLTALVYLFTKDKISTGMVVISTIVLIVYAGRQPRNLNYALFDNALAIGQKVFNYGQFRSFSISQEGPLMSVALVPHKRFGQLVTLNFDPRDETMIVGLVSSKLPMERASQDLVDGFFQKIRF